MNRSNNDIMWDCLEDIFNDERTNETYYKAHSFIRSYDEHDGEEVEYNFSHDNWLAVLCWAHYFNIYKGNVPSIGHHTRHPMRFIMFLWMKSNWFYPLRLLTMLEMILGSTIFARKTEAGRLHTSGILLDYYLCMSYDMKFMMSILTFIVEHRSWKDWLTIFQRYHGNQEDYNYKILLAFKRKIERDN